MSAARGATEQCPPGLESDPDGGLLGLGAASLLGTIVLVSCVRWAARSPSPRWPKLLAGIVGFVAAVGVGLWWLVDHILTCYRA